MPVEGASRFAPVSYHGGIDVFLPGMIRSNLHDDPEGALCEGGGRLGETDPLVAIVGGGGGGSWAALALAAAGVRRFRLLDMDRVEATNLNRQVAYCPADVGRRKIEVLAERLREWVGAESELHHARVAKPEDALSCLAGADFAVCAIDLPLLEIQKIMTAALRTAGTPGFFIGHGLPVNRVGPTVMPGLPGCPTCFREVDLETVPWIRHNFDYASYAGTALAACFAHISSYLVAEVKRYVAGDGPLLWRALLEVNFKTWEQEICRLDEFDLCAACRRLAHPAADPATPVHREHAVSA